MFKSLIEAKKKSFLLALQSGADRSTLQRIEVEYDNWLYQHILKESKAIIPTQLPFYIEDKKFDNLYEDIIYKNTEGVLEKFAYHVIPKYINRISGFILQLILPKEYKFFQYTVGSQRPELGKKLLNKLNMFPKGLIIFGVIDLENNKPYIYHTMTLSEWKAEYSYDAVGVRIEELRVFCKRIKLDCLDAYIHRDITSVDRGLVCRIAGSFYDLQLIEGKVE